MCCGCEGVACSAATSARRPPNQCSHLTPREGGNPSWLVLGSSIEGSSLVTEGQSTAVPLTAGTVKLRSVKRVPPASSGVDKYMKNVYSCAHNHRIGHASAHLSRHALISADGDADADADALACPRCQSAHELHGMPTHPHERGCSASRMHARFKPRKGGTNPDALRSEPARILVVVHLRTGRASRQSAAA